VPLVSAKPRPYAAREAREAIAQGACVLDLRDAAEFGEGHVPGALNVWIESPQFAERVAGMAPAGGPLLLMGAPSDLDRAVTALSRVGVDDIAGFLRYGMVEWRTEGFPIETAPQMTVHDLADWLEQGRDVVVLDGLGLSCPWPSMKLAKAIGDVAPGGLLEVLATDPGAPADLDAFSKRTGHRVVERSESGGVLRFVVQRGAVTEG